MHLVKPANAEILGVDKHGQPLFGLVNQTPDAFHDALFHIIDTVKQNSLQGKAVVSHSRGKLRPVLLELTSINICPV